MITERGEILTREEYDIRASIQKFRERAALYRLRRLALQYNLKGFMNKFAILFILLLAVIPASAQTLIFITEPNAIRPDCCAQTFDIGASVIRSSNLDPSPARGGGSVFPGFYYKASFDLPKGFEVQAKVRASRTPQLQTQFTTDEGEHKPAAELRINPEVRYNYKRFFVGAGIDYSKQFFADDDPGEEYARSYNLNPTVTVGARLTNRQEASFTYLFKDRYTDLYGIRANYNYALPVSEKVSVVFGIEANRYTFRETNREGYVDPYYEQDTVLLFDIAVRFGNKKHGY